MSIEFNRVYYYNNRPVVPLAHEHGGIYKCYVNFTKPTAVFDGTDFCIVCNAGGESCYHDHGRYDEVIESLDEFLSDEDIMFIPERYLKKEYFEKAIYDNVREATQELQQKQKELSSKIQEMKNELATVEAKLHETKLKLQAKDEACNQIYVKEIAIPKTVVINEAHKMSVEDFKEIYIAYLEYNDLLVGGVDNWEWYGESLRTQEEYEDDFNSMMPFWK